jgi:hypothetical protein
MKIVLLSNLTQRLSQQLDREANSCYLKIGEADLRADQIQAAKHLLATGKAVLWIESGPDIRLDDLPISRTHVIPLFQDLKKLRISAPYESQIDSIDFLSSLTDIVEICLVGYFRPGLSLKPIEKFNDIRVFEFENGLNKSQHKVIDQFSKIEQLSVKNLDVSMLDKKPQLNTLRARTVSCENLISDRFPELQVFALLGGQKSFDFRILRELCNLKEIRLGNFSSLETVPALNPNSITSIEMISCRHIKNIDSIIGYNNLVSVFFSDLDKSLIGAEEVFNVISKLRKLRFAYVLFNDNSETGAIRSKIEDFGLKYMQYDLAKIRGIS